MIIISVLITCSIVVTLGIAYIFPQMPKRFAFALGLILGVIIGSASFFRIENIVYLGKEVCILKAASGNEYRVIKNTGEIDEDLRDYLTWR